MNINLIASTVNLLQDTLHPEFLAYSDEREGFSKKFWPLLEKLSEKQLNLLRFLCHKKDMEQINKLIEEWTLYHS